MVKRQRSTAAGHADRAATHRPPWPAVCSCARPGNAPAQRRRLSARARAREAAEVVGDVLAVPGHQDLPARLEEEADAVPRIGDDARACSGRLEHPGCRRETDISHAVTGNVEHRQGRTVQGVVLRRRHVPDQPDVCGDGLVRPPRAAEQEAPVWQGACRRQEERIHPRLAIRQTVGQKSEVGGEVRVAGHGKMRGRVETVINRNAFACAHPGIGLDDRRAAAIGQNHVELGQNAAQHMVRLNAQARKRCWRVHVPEHADGVGPCMPHDPSEQLVVEHADAARLHGDVCV